MSEEMAKNSEKCSKSFCPASCMCVFKPPVGTAAQALWLGLILVIAVFAVKQVLINWSLLTISTAIEGPRLEAQKSAELKELSIKSDAIDEEITELRSSMYKEESSDKVRDIEKKLADLKKNKESIDKDIKEKMDKKYKELLRDAKIDSKWAESKGIGRTQWSLCLKFFLDLLKILGTLLIVFATLHIVIDAETSSHLKIYAVVCAAVTLFSSLNGGLINLLG